MTSCVKVSPQHLPLNLLNCSSQHLDLQYTTVIWRHVSKWTHNNYHYIYCFDPHSISFSNRRRGGTRDTLSQFRDKTHPGPSIRPLFRNHSRAHCPGQIWASKSRSQRVRAGKLDWNWRLVWVFEHLPWSWVFSQKLECSCHSWKKVIFRKNCHQISFFINAPTCRIWICPVLVRTCPDS